MKLKVTSRSRKPLASGFTLVEILIVMTCFVILSMLLFPVLGSVRRKARDSTSSSNLRQIGLALALYVEDHDGLYPSNARDFFDGQCFASDWGMPASQLQALSLLSSTILPYAADSRIFQDPLATGFTDDDDNGGSCTASAQLVLTQPMTFVQRTELSLPNAKRISALANPTRIDVLHTFTPWRDGWTLVLHADGHVKGMKRENAVHISQTPFEFD